MQAVSKPILCAFLDRRENTASQRSSCIYSKLCLQSWNNYPDLWSTECHRVSNNRSSWNLSLQYLHAPL